MTANLPLSFLLIRVWKGLLRTGKKSDGKSMMKYSTILNGTTTVMKGMTA